MGQKPCGKNLAGTARQKPRDKKTRHSGSEVMWPVAPATRADLCFRVVFCWCACAADVEKTVRASDLVVARVLICWLCGLIDVLICWRGCAAAGVKITCSELLLCFLMRVLMCLLARWAD